MPKKSGLLVIAVTGTPGAGKTSFAKMLSEQTGLRAIEVNDIVEEKKLFSGIDEHGSKIVKMQELKKELKALEKSEKEAGKPAIMFVGHLLADLKLDYDISIVVRANLKELISRLESRSYEKDKLRENLISESIDYCGFQIAELSKETYQVEKESDKEAAIRYLKERLAGNDVEKPNLPEINKTDEMLELVYEGNTFGL
jgi:adenylate kinase